LAAALGSDTLRQMPSRFRSPVLALVLLGSVSGALPAAATTTAVGDARASEARAIEAARRWQGRWCPPTGCGPPASASATSIGGFAAAALGAVVLARRRRP